MIARARLAELARDRRGASVIELAFVLPALILLLIGIIELSLGFGHRLRIEQAAFRTLELAHMRGGGAVDVELLRNEAANAANVPASSVTVARELYCNNVQNGSWDGVCATGAVQKRYVRVTIDTVYQPMFAGSAARFFPGSNPDGSVPLSAAAAVRTQ
jgi:hypothetical protein